MEYLTNLCLPAKIYLVLGGLSVTLSVLALAVSRRLATLINVFVNLLIVLMVTYGLNWVCGKSEKAAWIILSLIVLFHVLMFLAMLGVIVLPFFLIGMLALTMPKINQQLVNQEEKHISEEQH